MEVQCVSGPTREFMGGLEEEMGPGGPWYTPDRMIALESGERIARRLLRVAIFGLYAAFGWGVFALIWLGFASLF